MPFFAPVFFLVFDVSPMTPYKRAVSIAEVSTWTALRRDPAIYFPEMTKEDPDAARVKVAKLLADWMIYESSGYPDVSGDRGAACGLMQVVPETYTQLTGKTLSCNEMRKNAWTGAEAGAEVIEALVKQCGSLKSALGAYASGHCGWAQDLVERRCAKIGGC